MRIFTMQQKNNLIFWPESADRVSSRGERSDRATSTEKREK